MTGLWEVTGVHKTTGKQFVGMFIVAFDAEYRQECLSDTALKCIQQDYDFGGVTDLKCVYVQSVKRSYCVNYKGPQPLHK